MQRSPTAGIHPPTDPIPASTGTNNIKHQLQLLLLPLAVALALWLASACALQDEASPTAVESFPVGRIPRDVIFDGQHIWVANMGSDSVSKLALDGQLIAEFPAGSLPQALAFDGSNLWVTTATGKVLKLSTDGEILHRFNVGGILTSAVFDGRYLWVANTIGGEVTKIHPTGGVEAVYEVGVKPVDLLYDGKHIWVANIGNDTIVKLDANGQVLLTVSVEQPGDMAFDGRNLWVTNTGFPVIPGSTVTKLDTNGRQLGVFRTGSNPSDILYADGSIWVANALSDFNVTGTNLSKLSPDGLALGAYHAGIEPQALAFDGDNLWMVNRINDTVTKLSARGLPHEPPVEASHTPPVKRDPAYPRALGMAGIDPNHDLHPWLTDFSLHSVPYNEIGPGGPGRDGIPPIDNPNFETTTEADAWLQEPDPVLIMEFNGDVRAYPLQLLIWHEIVNDVVAGVPVAVTYCPLCNSAVAFRRTLDDTVYDFGTTGYLRHLDLIMWDRQTETWWQQITGEAIVGELTGKQLQLLPTSIGPWKDFKKTHPDGEVLSRNTGYGRPYDQSLYPSLDRIDEQSPSQEGPGGVILPVMERVVGVTIDEVSVAFPYSTLARERVVNYAIRGTDVVVFYEPETLTPFKDSDEESDVRSVGAAGVFSPHLNGQKLTFKFAEGAIVDEETGSRWNLLGQANEGPLTGQRLEPILHADHFWFAWLAFNPATQTYTPTP